jgi:hypothetical protein
VPQLKEENLAALALCIEKAKQGNGLHMATEVKYQFI